MSNPSSTPTAPFHDRVHDWMVACFTPEVVGDKVERNHRFLEESLELVQSLGCTRDEAHMLVDYVFCRPVGEPTQETGGVMVTLSALCNANDIVPTTAADIELARCWTKIDVIRAKQAEKPKHSPLPMMQEEPPTSTSDPRTCPSHGRFPGGCCPLCGWFLDMGPKAEASASDLCAFLRQLAQQESAYDICETAAYEIERLQALLSQCADVVKVHRFDSAEIATLYEVISGQRPVSPPTGPLSLDNDRQVFFYEQDHYYLSNFSAFNLRWNGHFYATSEHAYHIEKFRDNDIRFQIANAFSAHEAFKLAEHHRLKRRKDWDDVKVGIMKRILRAKADQHEYVRRKLLSTGARELIENSWRDDYWGWGKNRDGQNLLGKLWMEVRAELRTAGDSDG